MLIKTIMDKFYTIFNQDTPVRMFFAPGRINLIGEHIDYNGGFVLPGTISLGTYALVSQREDLEVHFYSENFPDDGIIISHLNDFSYRKQDGWANFPKGVIHMLQEKGYQLDKGLNIFFYGEIPNAAGLSSSASIEIVTAFLLKELFHFSIDTKDLVLLCQAVENHYIGVNSGIMDQFAIGFGKENHAILLDCHTLDYEYAPILLEDKKIIIIHTNKKRALSDSKYNERRAECEEALADLQEELDIVNLCELSPSDLAKHEKLIKRDVCLQRARHVVNEHERTKQAFAYLKENNLVAFGQLMNQSHVSLKDLYEVTGIELDTIVHTAQQLPGVLGARMTGAGFGGCAISIVQNDAIDDFKREVNKVYQEKIGYDASFYEATISDGMKELEVIE